MKLTLEDHKRLKPCPVCGNTPSFYCNGEVVYQIMCEKYCCDLAYSILSMDKETAIEAWNNLPERRYGDEEV